jgi:hypothetical protein
VAARNQARYGANRWRCARPRWRDNAFGNEPMGRRFRKATARTRLDRGPQSQSSTAGLRDVPTAWPRSPRSSCGSTFCHALNLTGPGGQAGDLGHPDRVRESGDPGWQRARRGSDDPTGRQHHRPVDPGVSSGRSLARIRQSARWQPVARMVCRWSDTMPVARCGREAEEPDAWRRLGVGGPKEPRYGNTSMAGTPPRFGST